MNRLLLLILLFFANGICRGQFDSSKDSSTIEVRSFNNTVLKDYKEQKQFQYESLQEPTMNLWDSFWAWFWWKVYQIMNTPGGRTTVWSVFGILGLAILAFFIYKVTTMNKGGIFARSVGSKLDYSISHENIHQINFEEAVSQAISNKNFRLATRLLYLQSLKILSDKNIIEWSINKTNTDYLKEVKEKSWNGLFQNLTLQFEYVWYGEKNVAEGNFQNLYSEFKQFHNQLK